jgi:hypothetical protein
MSGRHEVEIRRHVLVENPVIFQFMQQTMKVQKLMAMLQKEQRKLEKTVAYVKSLDRDTAKQLDLNALYIKKRPVKVKKVARRPKMAVQHANVIPFPVAKSRSKKAA